MLEEADRDGDGMLNFDEFYRIMRRRGDPLDDFDSDDEWTADSDILYFLANVFYKLFYLEFELQKL